MWDTSFDLYHVDHPIFFWNKLTLRENLFAQRAKMNFKDFWSPKFHRELPNF